MRLLRHEKRFCIIPPTPASKGALNAIGKRDDMEEIKIWAIVDSDNRCATPLKSTEAKSENLLEEILVSNPGMLEEGLRLVGRQTPAAGGNLDLLGVDSEGRLVVFELKRGTPSREAVAQIIDYASDLNEMDLTGELYDHIAEWSGKDGIQEIGDFEEWYNNSYSDVNDLMPPRMVLVGLGSDHRIERMVQYLADNGTDIELSTFYSFTHRETMLLARDVEVSASDAPSRKQSSGRMSESEKQRIFEERAKELNVWDIFRPARTMIATQFNNPRETAVVKRSFRTNFYLNRKTDLGKPTVQAYLFIELDGENSCVNLGLHPIAVDSVLDKLDELGISYHQEEAKNATPTEQVNYEVKFHVNSTEEWNARKDKLTKLTQSVYSAYQKSQSD